MIQKLHHSAFRCRDSEETRVFYEDFLGLPFVNALEIGKTATGRAVEALHTFFEMADGSYLAFFEVPNSPFEFKAQNDFDLHIALEVDHATLESMMAKARSEGRDVRGPTDHGMVRSIYFRDPSGYVVELAEKLKNHDEMMNPEKTNPRAVLTRWQAEKRT